MPSFVFDSLLWWGLPLIGLPVLIHLINLMRHRRVRWAAMEFLLQSQKRHRKSVLMKQLLLLALRMLAIAAVVLMVAQPLVRNKWGTLFGGSRTHHVVLVDDSFSMSERWADTSAFDQAKQVVARLAVGAQRQNTPQVFTLLRFSRCRQLARGTQPDLLEAPLDADFSALLERVLGTLHASQTAAGPDDALAGVEPLPARADDEDRVVYLVSDFRANQWQEPAALRDALVRLDAAGVQVHLVDCAAGAHQNAAISGLQPAPGTRAAGVPLLMEVTLTNFGPENLENVSVALEEDGQTRPPLIIDEVPPGKVVTRRFPVLFATAGDHQVTAQLEPDAVAADNRRAAVVHVPQAVEVLIVDGDARRDDAFFLATALSPGGKVASGLKPLVESTRALRDQPLERFDTVYLLNVARLDDAEIEALEAYVSAGGGLGIFMGEQSRAEFFNERLYRDGQGLFPLPLAGPEELLVDRLEKTPDVEVTAHPIFSVFAGERNSFLDAVVVNRYFGAEKNWLPEPDSGTRVIARLRNRAPLAVEHPFGQGRVVVFLTKASPAETSLGSWNNWGRDNPSYVVAVHELQSYLASGRRPDAPRLVGTPLVVPVDASRDLPQVRFIMPQELGGASLSVDATPLTAEPAEQEKQAPPGPAAERAAGAGHAAVLAETDVGGIYEARLTGTDGSERVAYFAVNVEPAEGNLKKLDAAQLGGRLAGVRYEFHQAGDINYHPQQLAGWNLSLTILYVLIGVLLAEQVLAYACSYHPRAREGRG